MCQYIFHVCFCFITFQYLPQLFYPPIFTGRLCETNVNDCTPGICDHGGNCSDALNDVRCQCPRETSGFYCEGVTAGGRRLGPGAIFLVVTFSIYILK